MIYRVLIPSQIQKELDKLESRLVLEIHVVLDKLKPNPRPKGAIKLVNSNYWRLKKGQHRVIYYIDDKVAEIRVVRISKRNEGTYKGL